ncbi:hypothetical protein KIW84_056103 [Lathyrus oleraceus]|uniref:Tf2-1-like SH3-like domain-containing protein n=1 Tax=Pisum sativum TaxID=3888 RepID=A0A9D4WXB7_PEA|nr:hypothetical protein KIW84_056103 [Pisum sativum]
MIQEKMRIAQSRQKSYHDKRRKSLEFQEGDHVFLRVTPITGVGRALKSKKLTPRFIGPYQILERIGEVAYRVALPPSLANLHEVFHVSQLRRYIHDPSHVVQVDDVQVRDNLTVETSPMRIEDRELKQLRGKEIALVKVAWGGPAGGNVTWELESKMKESYPELEAIEKEEKGQRGRARGRRLEKRRAWSLEIAGLTQLFTELESEVRKSSNGGKCGEFCILLCVSAGTAVLSALTG